MLEVARIRSRTSSDTFLSRFPPFFTNLKVANFLDGLLNDFEGLPCPVDRSWCAQRCCDGDAQTSSVALILILSAG